MPPAPLCACGCGEPVKRIGHCRKYAKFLYCHSARAQPRGQAAYRWKGGHVKSSAGYVWVYMPDHPKARGLYIQRSHLVAEQLLGRHLLPEEIVHHKNAVRDDDRPDNIEIVTSQSEHIANHNSMIRRTKLTADQVAEIRSWIGVLLDREIAAKFGVDASRIQSIKHRRYPAYQ